MWTGCCDENLVDEIPLVFLDPLNSVRSAQFAAWCKTIGPTSCRSGCALLSALGRLLYLSLLRSLPPLALYDWHRFPGQMRFLRTKDGLPACQRRSFHSLIVTARLSSR